MSELDVVYVRAGGSGWGPVDHLAELTARLLGGRLTTITDTGDVGLPRKLAASVPSRPRGDRALLFLASSAAHLASAARLQHWWPGYAVRAAWVIDSFWTERISRFARHREHFDRIFITDRDLVPEWEEATGAQVSWLPWGSDTLAFPPADGERPVDLLRLGRQPAAWDDDAHTARRAAEHGLRFAGRPPMSENSVENQATVVRALARSRFVLAFSNRVSPAAYTHPTREYLTGRWMDALAAGATIAGTAPASAAYTLWPGATLEIDPDDLDRGLATVRAALDAWSVDGAVETQRRARAQIDWRRRLAEIAEALGITVTASLHDELGRLTAGQVEPR